MSDIDFIKNIYQDFLNGTNIDEVLQVAANEGYVFLEKCFAKAKCDSFEIDALLLPGRLSKYNTLTAARKMGNNIIPEWIEYNADKDYFSYSEDKLTDAFIDHYGLKRINGRYTMNGKGVSDPDIKAAILKSLSIVRANPGQYVYSVITNLSIKASQQEPEQETKTEEKEDSIQSFLQAISSRKYEPMPTGLKALDDVIGGGFLRQTLVMMGAAPGMGKSFFAQQLFEGMAQLGHSVLYFNLEMSREQMLARSFARLASQREGATMTAIDVLQGYRWTAGQKSIMERTAAMYAKDIAPYMAYNPGGSTAQLDTILDQMNSAALRAANAGKDAPIVVIDYLHLLRGDQREDVQTTVKRAMDAFKGYAMRYNTVVFVILAFNRDSNKGGKVNQESGRDSSAIEYSADLMLGLNFAKVEENADSELVEKIRETARKELKDKGQTAYKLKILKNRLQGGTGSVDLMFVGKSGLFTERQNPGPTQESFTTRRI